MASRKSLHELSRREKIILFVPFLLWLVVGVSSYIAGVSDLMAPAITWSLLAAVNFALIPAIWLTARRVVLNWWAAAVVFAGLAALFNAAGISGWAGLATSCCCICALVALFSDPGIRKRLDLW